MLEAVRPAARNDAGSAGFALLLGSLWLLGCQQSAAGAPVEPLRYQLTIAPDAAYTRFEGRLTLGFETREPVERIVLESAQLDIASASRPDAGPVPFSVDEQRRTVALRFDPALAAGRHELEIRYTGAIGDHGPGLYRAHFDDSPPRGDLFSYLCCGGNVRYLFPVVPGSERKASFDLTLVLQPGVEAVSVMPVGQRRPRDDGRIEIVFQASPPMTPDLFFLAAGNFDRRAVRAGSTDIGVVLPPELAAESDYALRASRAAVTWLINYLDRPFPLAKVDSVVLPGAPGGAISSWGSIQYAARYLTVSEGRSSDEELLITDAIVAHETAHQWFGNLVTPSARSHLWLSEGLAVWLENTLVGDRHPDWRYWLRADEYREAAMRLDVAGDAHPVAYDDELMDGRAPASEIVYDKSAQILRMLANLVGEEAFLAALRTYLDEHAYGYASTDDFWAVLESVSSAQAAAVGRVYTLQAGVPLVDVLRSTCSDDTTTVFLRQSPFRHGAGASAPALWPIPVTVTAVSQGGGRDTTVMSGREASLQIEGCGAFKINAGNVGYFRTRYDARSFRNLRRHFAGLSTADQLGLLYDQLALAEAGYAPFDDYLDLVRVAAAASDPLLHLQWVRAVDTLDVSYEGHEARSAFRDAARRSLATLLERLTWQAGESEPLNTQAARSELIETLGRLGHAGTISEARERVAAVGTDAGRLPRATREAVFKAAGAGLDVESAAIYRRRAADSSDPLEARCYWLALASSKNDETAGDVLEWLLTDSGIDQYLRSEAVVLLARDHGRLVFAYLESNASTLAERLGRASYVALLSDVARQSNDVRIGSRLVRFVESRFPGELATAERAANELHRRNTMTRAHLPPAKTWSSLAGGPGGSLIQERR